MLPLHRNDDEIYIYLPDQVYYEENRDIFFHRGNYRFLNVIGAGGFGVVCRVRDTLTLSQYALKIEKKSEISDNEIRLYEQLAALERVPSLRCYFEENGMRIIVMELLGNTLYEYAKRRNWKFEVLEVFELAAQMIDCVEAVHSKGLIHLDIKPENFAFGLYRNTEMLRIFDFGLSQHFESPSGQHRLPGVQPLRGTVAYMSHNVHSGLTPSRRDDMESISYVLLNLLQGTLPWLHGYVEMSRDVLNVTKAMKKKEFHFEGWPVEFDIYHRYCHFMKFEQKPNYSALKGLFSPSKFRKFQLQRFRYTFGYQEYQTLTALTSEQKRLLLLFELRDRRVVEWLI